MSWKTLPLLCVWISIASAANPDIRRADPARPFSPLVVLSTQNAARDFYFHTLPGAGPRFSSTDKLFEGQELSVLVFAANYAVDRDNRFDVTYSATIERPDGGTMAAGEKLVIGQGTAANPQIILYPKARIGFSVAHGEPLGDYVFVITVRDAIGDETKTLRIKLSVVPFVPAALPADFKASTWMMGYFEKPQPALALAAVAAFAREAPADDKNAWPSVLGFYDALLTENPWLIPHFASALTQGAPVEQRALQRILGYALRSKKSPPAGVSADAWKSLAADRAARWPDPAEPLIDPAQLDLLWGRFFATGAFAHVERITATLEYHPYLGRLEALKKSGKKPKTVPPEVMKELVLQSALWSIGSIAKQHPLAGHYAKWILVKKDLDGMSEALLATALGLKVEPRSDDPKATTTAPAPSAKP